MYLEATESEEENEEEEEEEEILPLDEKQNCRLWVVCLEVVRRSERFARAQLRVIFRNDAGGGAVGCIGVSHQMAREALLDPEKFVKGGATSAKTCCKLTGGLSSGIHI